MIKCGRVGMNRDVGCDVLREQMQIAQPSKPVQDINCLSARSVGWDQQQQQQNERCAGMLAAEYL